MRILIQLIDLRSSRIVAKVNGEDPYMALREYVRSPKAVRKTAFGATTATLSGSDCWDSSAYPYYIAYRDPNQSQW